MGKLDGRVAFVTGAARGQGRSHSLLLAGHGADIITIDTVRDIETVGYAGATPDDFDETIELIEKTGRRMYAYRGDVRRQSDVDAAVAGGLHQFGRIDIVVANAGITTFGTLWELSEETWQTMIDVNLSGVFHTVKATVPTMIEAGRGGSIVMTGSCAIGLAAHKIRVNVVHPTTVGTDMFLNEPTYRVFRPDLDDPTADDLVPLLTSMNKLGVPWIDSIDVSNAVLWLASDDARYVTGTAVPVSAGVLLR
jgi:(+)-trans-carveol dehydrogenase